MWWTQLGIGNWDAVRIDLNAIADSPTLTLSAHCKVYP